MSWFRRKAPKLSDYEEAHLYARDIQAFSKLRDAAMQRMVIQPNVANTERLKRLDEELDIMVKTHLELTRKMDI